MSKKLVCAFKNCFNEGDVGSSALSFFHLPRNDEIREKWISIGEINHLEGESASKCNHYVICENHFNESSYYISKNKKRLYKNVLPVNNLQKEIRVQSQNATVVYNGPQCFIENKSMSSALPELADPVIQDFENTTLAPKTHKPKLISGRLQCSKKCKSSQLIKTLKVRIIGLKKQIQRKNKIIAEAKLDAIIDNIECSENAKTLCKMQLLHKKYTSWLPEEKQLSLEIYYRSPGCYKNLIKLGFCLPHPSTIKLWSSFLCMRPGFNNTIVQAMKEKASQMTDSEKKSVIVFDEISLKKGLAYSQNLDIMEGYEDFGDIEPRRTEKPAKYALVFLIRGLESNYKMPMAYFLSSTAVSGSTLSQLLRQCLSVSENCGLDIKAVVCDQATTNQSLCKTFKVSPEYPFFLVGEKKIYFIFDIVHLIKNIRNRLREAPFIIDSTLVKWSDIRDAYYIDKNLKKSRCLGHLSEKHVNPNNFEKMTVYLATQIFSHRTSTGIKTMREMGELRSETALNTAEFLMNVNNIFDILNSKYETASNPYKRALSKDNLLGIEVLQKAREQIKSWRVDTSTTDRRIHSIPPCFTGLQVTINAVIQLWGDLSQLGSKYLLTSRLNQDCLENCFSEIRGMFSIIFRIVNGVNGFLFIHR